MSAYNIPQFQRSYTAGADLHTDLYCLVKLDNTGKVVLAGAGELFVGVLQTKPKSGETCTVMVEGVTPVNVGTGNLTAGDFVASDASGLAVTGASGDFIGAIAETTGASGAALATILLTGPCKI